MKTFLKPMGIRDILDCTFSILRDRFWTFQGVIFFSYLPATIFLLIGLIYVGAIIFHTVYFQQLLFDAPRFWSTVGNNIGIFGAILLIILGGLFILSFIVGSFFFVHGTLRVFISGIHGQKITWKQSFAGLGKKWLWYLLNFFLMYIASLIISAPNIAVSFFTIFLNLPILQIIVQLITFVLQMTLNFLFCLNIVIIAAEDIDIINAFKRSFTLPSKHRWRFLGILFVVYLLAYVMFSLVVGITAIPIVLAFRFQHLLAFVIAGIFCILALLVISIFLPYYYGPLVAMYYDLIIRKEGYDLKLQLNEANEPTTINFLNRSI